MIIFQRRNSKERKKWGNSSKETENREKVIDDWRVSLERAVEAVVTPDNIQSNLNLESTVRNLRALDKTMSYKATMCLKNAFILFFSTLQRAVKCCISPSAYMNLSLLLLSRNWRMLSKCLTFSLRHRASCSWTQEHLLSQAMHVGKARLREVPRLLSCRYSLSELTAGRLHSSDVQGPGSPKGRLEGTGEASNPVLLYLFCLCTWLPVGLRWSHQGK